MRPCSGSLRVNVVSDYTEYRPDQVYDDGAAFQLYLEYLDGKETSETVLLRLMPLVYSMISRRFKGIQHAHKDDLFSEAATKVWKTVEDKKIPDSLPEVFYTYVIHAINSGLSIALRKLDPSYTRLMAHNMPPSSPRYPTVRQIDAKIFLEELPDLIRKRVLPTLRFDGRTREACCYVMDRILGNKRVVRRVLSTRFGINNPDFYIEHVQVRIRTFLYDVRDVFSDLTVEGDYLDVSQIYREMSYGE